MVVGLQHLLVCYVISSTLNWSQTLTTWKAIHPLSALSYRRDVTWNGWPECTIEDTNECEKMTQHCYYSSWIMLLVQACLCLKNNVKIACLSNLNNFRRMKVTTIIFCLHDLYYVNMKEEMQLWRIYFLI